MSEHTPTPWQVGPHSVNPFYIAAPDQGMTAFVGIVPIPMQTGRDESVNRANAAFIVKACNSHEELQDLATNVGGFDDMLLKSTDLNVIRHALREYRDQARAALASIKETSR